MSKSPQPQDLAAGEWLSSEHSRPRLGIILLRNPILLPERGDESLIVVSRGVTGTELGLAGSNGSLS